MRRAAIGAIALFGLGAAAFAQTATIKLTAEDTHIIKEIVLTAAAGCVLAGSAVASPLTLTRKTVDDGWEKTHMICDQFGRCWKERNRNSLLDSYNLAPPPGSSRGNARLFMPPGSVRIGPSVW